MSTSVARLDIPSGVLAPGAIGVGSQPYAVAVRGDQSLVYVSNFVDGTVSVVDTATNAVVASIAVGGSPLGLAVSADGTRVYVANDNSNNISVIDTASNTVTTIDIMSPSFDVALSPDGTQAYATNSSTFLGSDTVSVIDTATNTVTTIKVGDGAADVVFSPDGARAYVTNFFDDSVSVIDTATNAVTHRSRLAASPWASRSDPTARGPMSSTAPATTVWVIDTATNSVIDTISVGALPVGVAVSPDGTRVYVTNQDANTVSVIDTASNSVIGTIAGFVQPGYPGVCGNGNALLAAGRTFHANNGGAIGCTMTGPGTGPVFSGGTMQITGAGVSSALPSSSVRRRHRRHPGQQRDLLRHHLRPRLAHQDRHRHAHPLRRQQLFRTDLGGRRHACRERLDRHFRGDGSAPAPCSGATAYSAGCHWQARSLRAIRSARCMSSAMRLSRQGRPTRWKSMRRARATSSQ